jgi:hypothetical protein
MTKLLIAISVLLFMGIPFANAEQVYYCTSELATGIIKDKKTGKWKKGNFKEQRYTIKFNDDYTKLDGLDKNTWYCLKPYDWNFPEIKNMIVCYHQFNGGSVFSFDFKTLRFLSSAAHLMGYVENTKDPDTNIMNAGTCQKF